MVDLQCTEQSGLMGLWATDPARGGAKLYAGTIECLFQLLEESSIEAVWLPLQVVSIPYVLIVHPPCSHSSRG